MKKILLIFLIIILFTLPVNAEKNSTEKYIEGQAELSGADKLDDALPKDSRDYFQENNIKASEKDWINNIKINNIFSEILKIAKNKIKSPFICFSLILAVILLSSALSSVENSVSAATASFAVTAVSAAVITAPLISVINSTVDVMQSVSVFMTAFVPIFAAIIASHGQVATSVSMSSLLLGAAQSVELIANHFIIPLMCGYLSVTVVSGVSPLIAKTSFAETIKKISFWIMSLITTVFLGVLSIQTTINATADSLSMRTARFVIGSSVPVAGTVLSEALTTVTASLGILKTSVAIYGVVACCIIFLPLLIELCLWRLSLNIAALVSDIFTSNISRLLKSVDIAISVLCGIILLTMALFVISLSVVVSVGKV